MQDFGRFKKDMIKRILKKYWSYLFLLLIWFVFASPFFIKGNVPYASDYQVNFFAPWSTYSELSSPVKNNAMPDIINQIYPWKHFSVQTFSLGQVPLWNPYSFSGTPHLANYQSAVLSPFNLLFFILPFIDAWSVLVLLQPLLAGVFAYIFVKSLKRSNVASLISSISFMFCGFVTTWMGYATLGFAIIFLPLALLAVEKFFQTEKKIFLLILSLSIPLSFFSGHFQISLYFLVTVLAYILIKYLVTKNVKKSLLSLLYVIFGLLLSAPQLLPSIEAYSLSLRSGLFQKIEAIPYTYIPTLIAPDFFGNPVTRNDWFGHYAEWNGYVGLIPFMLAIYAIFSKKRKEVFYLFIFSVVILLLAFDTPLLNLLVFLKVPVLSTSAASRIIVIFSFVFSVLAAFGFDQLIKDVKEHRLRKIVLFLISFIIIFVLSWLVVLFNMMPIDKVIIARQNLILPTLIFLTFFVLLLIFYKLKKIRIALVLFSIFILAIVSFDMLRFATKWMPFSSKDLVFKEVKPITKLIKMSGHDRFLGNLGGEVFVYYNLPSVEGYDPVYVKRYGELISYVNDGRLNYPARSIVKFPKRGEFSKKAINLLGIKYIIYKKADGHSSWVFPFWEYEDDSFNLIYEDDKYQIIENKNTLPRAFLVSKYKVIKDNELLLDTLFSEDFDISKSIILEKDFELLGTDGDPGSASILKYTPNKIEILVNAKTDSLLFLSDTYYPGWKAFVDEKEKEIFRADYNFRAVAIEKGKHKIEFVYMPDSFRNGLIVCLIGGVGVLFILLPKRKFS